MANIFKRLSDVLRKAKADPTDTMLVVDNGEVKQAPIQVAAQADWAVTDPENPACILNKPTSLGGYKYFLVSYYKIWDLDGPMLPMWGNQHQVPVRDFEQIYKTEPVMVLNSSGNCSPVLYFGPSSSGNYSLITFNPGKGAIFGETIYAD